jgi:hypothetical protein
MAVNIAEIYSPDPFASGGTADSYKRRLLAAQLLQKKASEDDKVYSNSHGGMKLATALLGGMMEGWEERKAKQGQAAVGRDLASALAAGVGGMGGVSAPSSPSSGSPAGAPSLAGGGASRAMAMPSDATEMAAAIEKSAKNLGISPIDLATVISYETGGKMSPSVWGGAGGRHMGLIQFGPTERQMYGANPNQSFSEQMGAVERYLSDRGLKPGMGLMDLYSTINAGRPGRFGASDANNGGAPGTVADKVNNQMAGHRARAEALFGTLSDAPQADASEAAVLGGAEGFAVPNPGQDPTVMPVADAPSAAALADGLMAFNSDQPIQFAQNENRNQLQPLKPSKNTMSEDDKWWQDYMDGASRQWNRPGDGGRNMDFMPAPANDAALQGRVQVASSDPSFVPQPASDPRGILEKHDREIADALASGNMAKADQLSAMRPALARAQQPDVAPPQPVTIAETPEAVHRAERAMNPEAFAPVAPPQPPMPPERPPETYTPRAPRVPPQAMAQALMAGGAPPIDPNSNNAGAMQFAASGMGRGGQGMPQAPQPPPPQMAAPQAPSAPSGMYATTGQAPAAPAQIAASAPSQYAQAGPSAQQQQQVAQVTSQVAQAGGMTPQQLNEARRTLNNPHVPESVKSSLLQYIQKRFAPPTWKYENVPGYGLVAVNERDPNQTRDVRRVPEAPTILPEGARAINRTGQTIAENGEKRTPAMIEYDRAKARGETTKSFPEFDRERRQASAQSITLSTEKKGQELMIGEAVKGFEKAQSASGDATKRIAGYGQMAQAMQGFTPGATAEVRLKAKALLKDLNIIGDVGVSDAEAFQRVQRRLELAATPRGQGQITENERVLIRETIPAMTNSPEAIVKTIQMLDRLDRYEIQVAEIYRNNARKNGGVPNYLEISESVAQLGPPMTEDEKAALMDIKEGAKPRQPQPGAQAEERKTMHGKNYFKRGNKWYEE